MRSIVIASLFAIVALTGTAAQAEIMCTQHGRHSSNPAVPTTSAIQFGILPLSRGS